MKPKAIFWIALVIAIAIAVVMMKKSLFRSVKDSYFALDSDKLDQVPPNLTVIRPTRFPETLQKGVVWGDKSPERRLGRDTTFAQLVATAYEVRLSRVVLPPDAPQGNFDFLITTATNSDQQLQAAIKKQFGYIAHKQTNDTSVFFLKLEALQLTGMSLSPDDEKAQFNFKNGLVYFVHQKVGVLTGPVERYLKTPVLDETGLTNFYDYSVNWDWRMGSGRMDLKSTQKMLKRWGLGVEAGNAPVEMLVVEKAN